MHQWHCPRSDHRASERCKGTGGATNKAVASYSSLPSEAKGVSEAVLRADEKAGVAADVPVGKFPSSADDDESENAGSDGIQSTRALTSKDNSYVW